MDSELDSGAIYGCLPFDQFAIAQWDYSLPPQQDQEQWNFLAQRWLSMSRVDRSPYWEIHIPAIPSDPPPPDAPFLPTQEQIDRVLVPHQTIQERNISLQVACLLGNPVWIRTCYATNLQKAYEELIEAGLEEPENALVLDDKELYGGYGEDWTKILLRLPLLPDAVTYLGGDPEKDEGPHNAIPPDDDRFMPLYNASLQEKQAVYLLDEQALKTRMVKLVCLDIRGRVVWHYTIAPEGIWCFEANYCRGGALSRISEMCYPGGEEFLLHPGAQLPYDG